MDNLAPAEIDPSELPGGFTAADPNAPGGAAKHQGEAGEKEARKQAVLEQALDSDALARLRRIKLVKKDKAVAVENLIVSMAMQGKLPGQINEGRLIEMLEGIDAKKSSTSISIHRKKYAFDSDDDDDDTDLM